MASSGITLATLCVISVFILLQLCTFSSGDTTTKASTTMKTIKVETTVTPKATGTTKGSAKPTMPPKVTTTSSAGYVTFSVSLFIGASVLAVKMQH